MERSEDEETVHELVLVFYVHRIAMSCASTGVAHVGENMYW